MYAIPAYFPDEFQSLSNDERNMRPRLFSILLTISGVVLAILREQSRSSKSCKPSVGKKNAEHR